MANTLTTYTSDDVRDESILTGRPNLIRVMVEDEIDEPFWEDILSDTWPDKLFDICPYSRNIDGAIIDNITGKQHILKEARAGNLSPINIGCIDSDYDYIFAPYTYDSSIVNGNTFLLQTYTYAIENLFVQPETITDLISEAVKVPCEKDLKEVIFKLSSILYPLVIWSLVVCKNRGNEFCATDWHDILPLRLTLKDYDENQLLEMVKDRVKQKEKELAQKYTVEEWKEAESELKLKVNITPLSAYKYIRGHDLFNYIHTVFTKPIADKLRRNHLQSIRSDVKLSVEEIQHYLSETSLSIKELLYRNFRYKDYAEEAEMIGTAIQAMNSKQ